jgi:arginyl-tRNA synthetase
MLKTQLKTIVQNAFAAAHASGALPSDAFPDIDLEEPKAESHGDLATNAAMVSAKAQKMAPRKIAEAVVAHLDDADGIVARTDIAGPGFINFFIQPSAWLPVLQRIHREDQDYGRCDAGRGRRIQVEFVSSNPTGPLHVGHGRGAAVGDSVANLLAYAGWQVQREYYINDSGRQIQTLGRSVYLRYRQLKGDAVDFPEDCYQGDYIHHLAADMAQAEGDDLDGMAAEAAIDRCARYAASKIIAGIRSDLEGFGVVFDRWFSEQGLYDDGRVSAVIDDFRQRGLMYEKDGALWFRSADYGDEKDRVVVRKNGQTTYFASDIAYHQEKFSRGFDTVIDVWGADHHGYIPRMSASVEAGGYHREQFEVILVQLVNLMRSGEPVAMSTRAGEFVTLADVLDEVGSDAARFLFLTRSASSPLDFDLELAKQKTNDNPVYYVQYVHARICSIDRKAQETGHGDADPASALGCLTAAEEIGLIKRMARYPDIVRSAAELREPHRITFYLMQLAQAFHGYYNKHRVLVEDPQLAAARRYLITAVKKVIRNGLNLLGVSAPEQM